VGTLWVYSEKHPTQTRVHPDAILKQTALQGPVFVDRFGDLYSRKKALRIYTYDASATPTRSSALSEEGPSLTVPSIAYIISAGTRACWIAKLRDTPSGVDEERAIASESRTKGE
jgi:hypothetical protein